ncbi:NAD-dependent epimerase/dehydratase family protein [bacterium]|nr:MAG: NAD-dependent epimerase/dehydratase family protein [bacterium]
MGRVQLLVTGAAGFIGSRLCRVLLERGDSVVGLDNFDPYYARELKQLHLQDIAQHPNFTFHELDLRDEAGVFALFESNQFEAVAHIAAMAAVRYSVQNPLVYGQVNVQGTAHLLDASRRTTKARCVLASTGSVYGSDTPVPFDEGAPAVHPLAPYPASKRAMELFAYSFAHLYELPTTVVRFFNVYGPHGRPDMMPWQWSQKISKGETLTLFNDGHMKRDWTYCDDIVRGFVAALDNPFPWEIINLGGGNPVENARFVHILEELVGRKAIIQSAPAPSSEPLETWASIEKAKRLLGWEPQIRVEEGLSRFISWMKQEGFLE